MKLSEVKVGDILIADAGFTCLKAGEHKVRANKHGWLFISCDEGEHLLEGQVAFKDRDLLVGLKRKLTCGRTI